MKEHFICTGGCHGEKETPGVCMVDGCLKEGQELVPCACEDGNHLGEKDDPITTLGKEE